MELKFIGTRSRDFTTEINGNRYYVQIGKLLEVSAADGDALAERDPQLWEIVTQPKRKRAAVAVEVEPEPLPEQTESDDQTELALQLEE